MTPDQKDIVRRTWALIVPDGDAAARLFYGRLFAIAPEVEPLFATTDAAAQRRKLLAALAAAVAGLDTPDRLIPVLADLGRRHVGYGVEDAHYDIVGAALLWTLERGLGDAWNEAVAEAWTAAYGLVAGVMRDGARQAAA